MISPLRQSGLAAPSWDRFVLTRSGLAMTVAGLGWMVIAALAAGLALLAYAYVYAPGARAQTQGLDCISCHKDRLPIDFHDKLGRDNKLCWSCHDGFDMKSLRLADGTLVPRSQSPQLCGQCHQQRYSAWQEGTHGIPGSVAGLTCSKCHDPHRPQMVLLGLTKPHPDPAPAPPRPPASALLIIGGATVFMASMGIVMARRGK